MKYSKIVEQVFQEATDLAYSLRHEFLTPEHLLYKLLQTRSIQALADLFECDTKQMQKQLLKYLKKMEKVPSWIEEYQVTASQQMTQVIEHMEETARKLNESEIKETYAFCAMTDLQESMASNIITSNFTIEKGERLAINMASKIEEELKINKALRESLSTEIVDEENEENSWRLLVTCVNDQIKNHNPLIGRDAEIERTIQVLCRKEKNNPLHIGEPGVGKTSLVYGLAARIEEGNVPDRLKGCRIYLMDIGQLLAGASYRGEFERRIKSIMEGVIKDGNVIIYIDEIHNLIGAGSMTEGSLDAANLLKQYLDGGEVRFIGSTTFQEYKRFMQKNHGLVRRFQQIEIAEPSIAETVEILKGLMPRYEQYHGVVYTDDVIQYAVEVSARLINERFLPDKAIDLLDEAGAFLEIHPDQDSTAQSQTVNRKLVNDILARICKIDPKSLHEEDDQGLETLDLRLKKEIFGQDHAIRQVVEAVQMGKAGLLEEDKPTASLLFVGPTGVGKTEVCKVLARELGIQFIRFDMSEYTEKHTVAKLIGSPAGYVGYEEGGLLTDAIRKTPHCVLLLDEIEKAHSDIYNILLQVMDYARLTDNKGQKADFRHVILIMTSNAGAQFAHQASLGFGANRSAGEAMLQTVRKTFKPEFLNRLTGTVVFNDMDQTMAEMILDKKIAQLQQRLSARNVTLHLSPAAHDLMLHKGFTAQFGAREMDRVIQSLLTPILTREILFGSLHKGGHAYVEKNDDETLKISNQQE